jgi:hypothetical protein
MKRPLLERLLDRPQRWIEKSAIDSEVKLLLAATFRYVKQIARSKSARKGDA